MDPQVVCSVSSADPQPSKEGLSTGHKKGPVSIPVVKGSPK